MTVSAPSIRVFTTCPQSKHGATERYAAQVAEVAAWSEDAGFHGILVYTDNSLVDPWLVAQLIMQETRSLSPLVAVQPVYMHPYAAAKMIASLAFLHGRRLDVNLVAGGFRKDLLALADETPHDERYERLVEYGEIVRGLLTTIAAVQLRGRLLSRPQPAAQANHPRRAASVVLRLWLLSRRPSRGTETRSHRCEIPAACARGAVDGRAGRRRARNPSRDRRAREATRRPGRSRTTASPAIARGSSPISSPWR